MPKHPTEIVLSPDEEQQLLAMRHRPKAQARYAERAQIILRAAEGTASKEIAGVAGGPSDGQQVAHTLRARGPQWIAR